MPRFQCLSCSKTTFINDSGEAFSQSIAQSCDKACFAILEPLAAVLTFLKCSFFLVLKALPISPV